MGFVCHQPQEAALARPPLVPWQCPGCGAEEHRGSIRIFTEGRQDFIENTVGRLPEDRCPDAFGAWALDVECCRCGASLPGWVQDETM
jgi:hypothetical protein